ncbi:MAG: DNA-binding transcriptional regulator, LysR family [Frankiales bacterium]|nr:DNA-binding transcriptional regulator, LysR family [Frankiales bacterium]
MELRHLEHFLAVAEERSFTRAAARIHLVQSALSVSVKTLERELGAQLFDRTTHSVELTDAGVALVVEARRTLAAADAARDAVAAVRGGVRGTVRVGIMHSLALIDLAGLLTRYHREHPEVRLVPSPAEGGSVELAQAVLDGRLDLAFASPPAESPKGLDVRSLAAEEMLLACPPDHPLARRRRIALSELDGERFVDYPPGWGTRVGVDRLFADAGLHRQIQVEVGDVPTVAELVRAGFGFAFIGPSTLPQVHDLVLQHTRPAPEFSVALVTPSARPLSAAARAFIALVHATFPKRS